METENLAKLDIEIREKESQLTSLKAEIVARQRLIAGLNDKVDAKALQDKARRLEDEVSVRDKQIAVLNDRLIVLDSQKQDRAEGASNAARVKGLEAELASAKVSRDEAEDLLRSSRIELEEVIGRCNDTVTALEGKNSQLLAKLSSQQLAHDTALTEAKASYEETIAKAGHEIEAGKTQVKTLSSQVKAQNQQIAENESELQDLGSQNSSLKERLQSLSLKLQRLEQLNLQLEQVNSQSLLLKGTLSTEVEKHQALLLAFQKLQYELKEARDETAQLEECSKEQQVALEQAEFKIRREAARCQELEAHMSKLQHSYKGELTAMSSRLELTAAELEQVRTLLIQKKVEAQEVLQLKNELRLMREQITALAGEKRSVTERMEKAELERERLTTELRVLQKRLEGVTADLTAKLEATESAFKDQESKHKQARRKFQSELAQSKSEFEEKAMKVVHLQGQLDELRKKLQETQSRVKALVAEQLTSANAQLEEKDQQIKLLKEMLRSSQTQVRQRDEEVARLKKKSAEGRR